MKKNLLISFLCFYITSIQSQVIDFEQINASTFDSLIHKKPGSLIDVRTSSEFKNGHIENAGQLNFYALDFKKKLLLLPKDHSIYLYCNTGYRSKRAANYLTENNFTKVYNLENGIMEWNQEERPIIIEPDAKPDSKNKMEPDEFDELIRNNPIVLIDFYAPWCAPCQRMMPMIDSIKKEYADQMLLVKVNADASKKLIKNKQIPSVPYLVLYKNASFVFVHKGLINREQLIKELNKQVK